MSQTGITVGELIKQGRRICGTCNDCGHKRLLTAEAMAKLDPSMLVSEVRRLIYCGCCGSKQVISTAETSRQVRQGRDR